VIARNAWLAQHLSNHDFPRQVSRFGNDTEYRAESAKLLAALTHTMPGTPYVYQGEEIGMTNVSFDSIEDYNDPYTVGQFHAMKNAGVDEKEIWDTLRPISRDNPRTPYQWNASENAGFTTGKPWIKMNPRYTEINYEADRAADNSIFEYYKELIAMRKTHPAMVDGNIEFYLMDHPQMVVYTRKCARETLLVVANFSNETVKLSIPEELCKNKWKRILTNRKDTAPSLEGREEWLPWEAEIYSLSI